MVFIAKTRISKNAVFIGPPKKEKKRKIKHSAQFLMIIKIQQNSKLHLTIVSEISHI